MSRRRLSHSVAAGCLLALGASATTAYAADLSYKDPPASQPAPSVASDFHGFVSITVNSQFVNPQGQVLTQGNTAPVLDAGLSFDVYKNATGPINKVSVYGAIEERFWTGDWSGYWANFQPNSNGSLYESDWGAGVAVTFAKHWTIDTSYWEFYSQAVQSNSDKCKANQAKGLPCVGYPSGSEVIVALSYDDSWMKNAITINPYVKFWQELGGSGGTICFSCDKNGYNFFVGMTPSVSMARYGFSALTLQAPTWFTVGPESFWDASPTAAACSKTHSCGSIGYFTTGLTGVWDLSSVVPAKYGKWEAKTGVQWRHLVNDNLVADEKASVGKSDRDPVNVFVNLNMSF